jgi:hypothetical protein
VNDRDSGVELSRYGGAVHRPLLLPSLPYLGEQEGDEEGTGHRRRRDPGTGVHRHRHASHPPPHQHLPKVVGVAAQAPQRSGTSLIRKQAKFETGFSLYTLKG